LSRRTTYPSCGRTTRSRVRCVTSLAAHAAPRAIALALVLIAAGSSSADEIEADGVNYSGVRINGFANGYVSFRLATGDTQSARIDKISLLKISRGSLFTDFNQAERFVASGEPARAVSRYRRMFYTSDSFWSDLLAARLCRATDEAGQFGRATGYFIRVAQGKFSGPASAVYLMPKSVPKQRNAKAARALEQLSGVIGQLPEGPARSLLLVYRYQVLRSIGDHRADAEAKRLEAVTIDESIGTDEVYGMLLSAMRSALRQEASIQLLVGIDHAIRACPESRLPDFLLLKGDALLSRAQTRKDLIRASWPYLRVVTHFPDDPRAADGLIAAAGVLKRMESFDKAKSLLTECLNRPNLTEPQRRRAEDALAQLHTSEHG